jgi:hypothetical protein
MNAALRLAATIPAMGLLGFLRWFAQKRNLKCLGLFRLSFVKGSPHREMQTPIQLSVLKRSQLTPNHQLHLVIAMGQQILLCTHPQGCSIIPFDAKPAPAEVAKI